MNSTPDEVLWQLFKWKNDMTRLLIESVTSGVATWCAGTLTAVSPDELRFGVESIDRAELLLTLSLRTARFRWLSGREGRIYIADMLTIKLIHCLEISSEPDGKVMLGEISSS